METPIGGNGLGRPVAACLRGKRTRVGGPARSAPLPCWPTSRKVSDGGVSQRMMSQLGARCAVVGRGNVRQRESTRRRCAMAMLRTVAFGVSGPCSRNGACLRLQDAQPYGGADAAPADGHGRGRMRPKTRHPLRSRCSVIPATRRRRRHERNVGRSERKRQRAQDRVLRSRAAAGGSGALTFHDDPEACKTESHGRASPVSARRSFCDTWLPTGSPGALHTHRKRVAECFR